MSPNELRSSRRLPHATPAVSVIIPAYNSARLIGETLSSVFAQTFADYEVVVVNDGSPDTEELEQVLQPYRARIVYIEQKNSGPAGARNAAIQAARGEYVAFLDSDDIWLPSYLAEQLEVLRADDSIALVSADAVLFGGSALAGQTFMQLWPSREPVTVQKLLTMKCAVLTSCVVARKERLMAAGLFDEEFLRSEDYDLWLRLAHKGARFAYTHKVLARHRVHDASLAADEKSLFESQIAVYQKLSRTEGVADELRQLIARQIERCEADIALLQGKSQLMAGQYAQAIKALNRAHSFYRTNKLRLALFSLRIAPGLLRRAYQFQQRRSMRSVNAV